MQTARRLALPPPHQASSQSTARQPPQGGGHSPERGRVVLLEPPPPPGPGLLRALCAVVRTLGQGHRDAHPCISEVCTEASLSPAAGTACAASAVAINVHRQPLEFHKRLRKMATLEWKRLFGVFGVFGFDALFRDSVFVDKAPG